MLKLVADDFGIAKSVNDSIIPLLRDGSIEASLMANGLEFRDAVKQINESKNVKIGIHLVLVEEKSILPAEKITSLVNKEGRFRKNYRHFFSQYFLRRISRDEVREEWDAQIKKCVNAGVSILFLNSHQHLHLLPGLFNIAIDLAKKYKIPYIRTVYEPVWSQKAKLIRRLQLLILNILSWFARRKIQRYGLETNDYFIGFLSAGNFRIENFEFAERIAKKHPKMVIEAGCHPGPDNDTFLERKYSNWGKYNWGVDLHTAVIAGVRIKK